MLEEVPNFVVSVIIAAVLIAAAAAMLMYFNPQRVADYGAAAVYPLVRPLNGSHVWLGVKPAFGPVEVEYVAYDGIRIPVGAQLDGPAWLNYSGGPVAVPCGANVTIVARHGLAARAESFAVICLQRQASIKTDLTSLEEALISYADYVADYAFYAHVPVLSAFFRFGSLDVDLQNVGKYPYMVTDAPPSGYGLFVDGEPSFRAATIIPNGTVTYTGFASKWPYGGPYTPPGVRDCTLSEVYRWMNIYIYWNDTLQIWINNVKFYDGPPANFSMPIPQGLLTATVEVNSTGMNGTLTLSWTGPLLWITGPPCQAPGTNVVVPFKRGFTQWSGWVLLRNAPFPTASYSTSKALYVMPGGPWFGNAFGVIPPFQTYGVHAFVNSSGLVVQWADPTCGMGDSCIETRVFSSPGTYYIDFYPTAGAMPVYIDSHFFIAVHRVYDYIVNNWFVGYKAYAVVTWRSRDVSTATVNWANWYVGTGYCTIDTSANYVLDLVSENPENKLPFDGSWWELQCQGGNKIRLVFNPNMTVSVYRDGQYLYNVYIGGQPTYPADANPPSTTLNALRLAVYWDGRTYAVGYAPDSYYLDYYGSGYTGPAEHWVNSSFAKILYKYVMPGAYVYTLKLSINSTVNSTSEIYDVGSGNHIIFQNYTFAGYLALYLDGKPVSYDAFYGWGVIQYIPPPPEIVWHAAPLPDCVPTYVAKPAGEVHSNLQNYTNWYSVTVDKAYNVTEMGCGQVKTYTTYVAVDTVTVNGHDYHVMDPKGKTCGYNETKLINDIVYCKENSS
jgi:hypothetical protein